MLSSQNQIQRKQSAPKRRRQRNMQQPKRSVRVSAPVNTSIQIRGSKPKIITNKRDTVIIHHKEFVSPLTGVVGDFSFSNVFRIQPGLQDTFPWLAMIARNFESYYIRRLTFSFESLVNSTTNGAICMAIDYDPADLQPVTKQALMSNPSYTKSNIWAPCDLRMNPLDAHKLGKQKFIRCGIIGGGQDLKTFDVGKLWIFTTGLTVDVTYGELYVNYEVELITPQYDVVESANCGSAEGIGLNTKADIFAGMPIHGGAEVFATGVPNELRIPSGLWFFHIISTGTVIVSPTVTISTGAGLIVTDHSNISGTTIHVGTYLITANSPIVISVSYLASATITSTEFHIITYNVNLN